MRFDNASLPHCLDHSGEAHTVGLIHYEIREYQKLSAAHTTNMWIMWKPKSSPKSLIWPQYTSCIHLLKFHLQTTLRSITCLEHAFPVSDVGKARTLSTKARCSWFTRQQKAYSNQNKGCLKKFIHVHVIAYPSDWGTASMIDRGPCKARLKWKIEPSKTNEVTGSVSSLVTKNLDQGS